MKKIKVLTICGSGVVTSSMIAYKIKELLSEHQYDVTAVEANPSELESYVMRDKYNFIAYASPIHDSFGVPAINGMGLVTGLGDDEFVEKALDILLAQGL
jgi:galactitol PTS system EIIB component